MSDPLWPRRSPPAAESADVWVWTGEPATPGELTRLRGRLRADLGDGSGPAATRPEEIERLLLVFEELASNGLRHGEPPVRVMVTTVGSGWLLEVSDGSIDRPPEPAVGRDAAAGGLGLYLVARLSAAHGWTSRGGRKHVWAHIEAAPAT